MRTINNKLFTEYGSTTELSVGDCCEECINIRVMIDRGSSGHEIVISRKEASSLAAALRTYLGDH